MEKDIDKYWDAYQEMYGFEEILRVYREKKALEFLHQRSSKRILEVGCGFRPLFTSYNGFEEYTAVEPGIRAYQNLIQLSQNQKGVRCVHGFLEDSMNTLKENQYDSIVLGGVLHEVENPLIFLKYVYELMEIGTTVYINVPNAKSFHRELGKRMGVIDSVYDKTQRNILLDQKSIFDHQTLRDLIDEAMPHIEIIGSGTFFIKPFTHDQMQKSLELNIISESMIEGLFQISEIFPDHGSEIFYAVSRRE
jgi:SAM-dependent methyltransferase